MPWGAFSTVEMKTGKVEIRAQGLDGPAIASLRAVSPSLDTDDGTVVIYEDAGEIVGYALFREQEEEIYLRQLFIVRHRRRQGLGRRAVEILRSQIWPTTKRLTVEALTTNTNALAFWRAVGYSDYSLTLEIMPDSSRDA